jgi:hypothetical protein
MVSKEKLNKIEDATAAVIDQISEAVDWVNTYEKDLKRNKSIFELKTQRIELNRLKNVITKKPVIALFGASQVGKSYMANNLLCNMDNKFEILNPSDNKTIDFIKYINPEGLGKESTGIVTRFTSDSEKVEDSFPFKIILFSIRDLICVLVDTYFLDYSDKTMPSKSVIEDFLKNIVEVKSKNRQQKFKSDDIYYIQEYISRFLLNTNKNSFVINLIESNFWNILADNIEEIEHHNWCKILKILWNSNEKFNLIFENCLSLLLSTNFSEHVYVNFEAIDRDNRNHILHVRGIETFFKNDNVFQIKCQDGQLLKVDAAKLCYLTSELVLTVSPKTIEHRPFIRDVDIVDFPGARSRLESPVIDDENILIMMRRGKVSYLFNSYSVNYKTNILSVCMRTSQTNVTGIPALVNRWITDNLGNTPEIRGENLQSIIPPLFVIFTWWNTQLEYNSKTSNANPSKRNSDHFEELFPSEILGTNNWNLNWRKNASEMKKFDNYFLLRDFKVSNSIFKQNADGTEDNSQDCYVNNEIADYNKNFKSEFIRYHLEKKIFFKDPEKSFNEASLPGKDGSEWIIENLSKIANNDYTTPIYLNKITDAIDKANKIIADKYHSDNKDEQINKHAKTGAALQLNLSNVFGNNAFLFGDLIGKLLIQESEILKFYHELLQGDRLIKKKDINKYILIRLQNPGLINDKLFHNDNLEILRLAYKHKTIQETMEHFKSENIDLDELFYGDLYNLENNSLVLANEAQQFYFENKLVISNFKSLIDLNINSELLEAALNVFKRLFVKQEINKVIASHIREYVDVQQKIDKTEDMIAHITAGLINKFITSAGASFMSKADTEELMKTDSNYGIGLNLNSNNKKFESTVRSSDDEKDITVEKLLDYMDKLNENLNKKPIDISIANYVPMILNYNQWIDNVKTAFVAVCEMPNYDPVANERLGEIIKTMNEIKLPEKIELIEATHN